MIRIKHSHNHRVLLEIDAETLAGANLRGAALAGANLRQVTLVGASLAHADLRGANLYHVPLAAADLSGANLNDAYLLGADLSRVVLRGADLTAARLKDANLTGADLTGADLTNADLCGACLSEAVLAGARGLDDLTYDERTDWGDYLPTPPDPMRRRWQERRPLWRCWVDILDPDCDGKVQRLEARIQEAREVSGELRKVAAQSGCCLGAGHSIEEMNRGFSGSGFSFEVYSGKLFAAFMALGDGPISVPEWWQDTTDWSEELRSED